MARKPKPERADVCIIGAGLVGTQVALLRVLVRPLLRLAGA